MRLGIGYIRYALQENDSGRLLRAKWISRSKDYYE